LQKPGYKEKQEEAGMIRKRIWKTIRKYFITGMIVIIPLWLTILLVRALVNLISRTFTLFPPVINPRTYLHFYGAELLVGLIFIVLIGLIASNYLGKKFLGTGEKILDRIPVVKTIYQSFKHLTIGVLGEKRMFSKVVLLKFSERGISFIGFVTGEDQQLVSTDAGKRILKVFIPTTPNPTTGFFCLIPEEEVNYLDITVDEAFRVILSAGYASPRWSDQVYGS
jgi:uncharacterized membrane protein